MPASEGIVGVRAALRQPVLVPDVTADPRYAMVNRKRVRKLAIPMIHKNRVMGVLDLEEPQLNYFTEEHVQTLSVLAAQLAVSLENARLYEQVARDEARMDRELHAAQRMAGRAAASCAGRGLWPRYCGRASSRLAKSAATFTTSCVTARSSSAWPWATSAAKAVPQRSTVQWLLEFSAAWPAKLQPAEMLRHMNKLLCERRIEAAFITLCFRHLAERPAQECASPTLGSRSAALEERPLRKGEPGRVSPRHLRDVSYEEWGVVLRSQRRAGNFTPTAWPKAPTLKVNSTGPIVYGK